MGPEKWRIFFQQITAIGWEHYKIRKRHFFLTALEVCLPIVIFMFVAYGRSTLPSFVKEYVPVTYNDPITEVTLATTINIRDTKLLFAPYTDFTDRLTREVQNKLSMYNEAIMGFYSKEEILNYYRQNSEGITVVANFGHLGQEVPKDLNYNLQIYEDGVYWETERLYRNDIRYISGAGSHQYLDNQFMTFQWALDTSYIEMLTNQPLNFSMNFVEFPYPPHWTDDAMNDVFVHLLPFLTMICFIFLFVSILKIIVEEKTSGMKQLMKINGLKSWAYWLGWFANAYFLCAISAIVIAVMLTQRIFHDDYAPLQHVQVLHLSLLILLYCSATITFIFSFSILFKNATLAMVIGITFWFLSYMIYVSVAINMEVLPLHVKYLASLLPHIALYYGFEVISVGEIRARAVSFTEQPRGSEDDLTMQMVLIILLLDTALFLLIAIFCETNHRGKSRASRIYSYFKKIISKQPKQQCEYYPNDEEVQILINRNIEEKCDVPTVLEIRSLTKKYGDIIAVNDLNLKIYENSLTVLLGHNGAGKTTTLSILAGLEQETSGELILKDFDSINLKDRQLVSICPQDNMLFPELSVEEHLIFFGMLKDIPMYKINQFSMDLLENKLKLQEKRHELVKNLSGGMKRKLSIGIAMMGNPKLVILDEPTAGIDPEGRRDIWDMILECKNESSFMISTHMMEEAEELADRVAIIAHGRLACYGTPIFLKGHYGVGYRLQLECEGPDKIQRVEEFIDSCMGSKMTQKKCGDTPCLVECCIDKENESKLSSLLTEIEQHKNNLSIKNYTISSLSLEDVFLKTSIESDEILVGKEQTKKHRISSISTTSVSSNMCDKFVLITKMKFNFLKKTGITWLSMIGLFYLLIFLTFTMNGWGFKDLVKNGKTLQLQLDTYGSTNVYHSIIGNDDKLRTIYEDLIRNSYSISYPTDNVSQSVIEKGVDNIVEYKKKLIVGVEIAFEGHLGEINVMYGNQAIHGAPISLNLVNNALLKYLTGNDHSIIASHTPLGAAKSIKHQTHLTWADNLPYWMILLPTGCLFSVIMFTALPTLERNTLMKTLFRMCNLHSYWYWIVNYITDITIYLGIITFPIAILSILSWSNVTIIPLDTIGKLTIILVWYGVTIIPFTYSTSFFAKSIPTAFAKFLMTNIIFGSVWTGTIMTVEMSQPYLAQSALLLCAIIQPHVILTYTLSTLCLKMIANHNWDLKSLQHQQMICQETLHPCCNRDSIECLNDRSHIPHPEYLAISTVAAFLLLLAIILGERGSRFVHMNCNYSSIKIENVKKTYRVGWLRRNLVKAVKNLSFEVKKGECFGLLGVNGAGKSTSFKLLTSQEKPTEGNIFINDKIGYCPQDHAMIGLFTGKELLTYFGKLRNSNITEEDIDNLLEKCGLYRYRNRPCGTYSGGNKRKLNTCISLIEAPNVIALDEPTTGVDPKNRKLIENLVMEAKNEAAIIFTSHSMDECEKLCDRLVIMKEGLIVTDANQTVRDLKNTYNVGHVIQIKTKSQYPAPAVLNAIKEYFPKLEILENRNNILTACIKKSDWITILRTLDYLRSIRKDIIDYTVKESSLEQVFLKIARSRNNDVNV